MCFSPEADLVVGVGLLPVAVMALREVRHPRELPFALLPLLFALHQLVEVLVWPDTGGSVCPGVQEAASLAYVFFALPVLPILVSSAVLLLEPRDQRLRIAPFVVLGAVVTTYLTSVVVSGSVQVEVHPHALVYRVGLNQPELWTTAYVVAVVGPSLASGYRSIVALGAVNLVGLIAVAVFYVTAFASLWCVLAACSSVLVVVHLRRRRRLPDVVRQASPTS